MQIQLKRKSDQLYEGKNSAGHTITLGNIGLAVSPMESLLMAGAACASIDLETILQKMQQPLIDFEIKVSGDRAEEEVPKVFKNIHLHFVLYGQLDPTKVARALELSIEKYCSVLTMMAKTAEISYGFEIMET